MSTQDQLEDDYRTVVSDLVRQPLDQALAQVKVLHEELAEDVRREVTGLAQAVRAARNAQDRAGGEHAAVRTQVQELTTLTRAAEAKAEAVVAEMRQLATASKEVTAQLADQRARLGTVESGLQGIAQQCATLHQQSRRTRGHGWARGSARRRAGRHGQGPGRARTSADDLATRAADDRRCAYRLVRRAPACTVRQSSVAWMGRDAG